MLGHGTDGHGWHEKRGWNDGHEHVLAHVLVLIVMHGPHEIAVIRSWAMHGWHDTFGCVGGQ
jgi:hypothetical protein